MPKSSSFTVTAQGGVLRELKSLARVSQSFNPATDGVPPAQHEFTAIWDTGATNSVITQGVVDACGLRPTGMAKVQGFNSVSDCEVYLVNIILPNNVGIAQVRVTKGGIPSGADILIGMDIIVRGDFSVTNKNGITVFSFRIPSQVHTDYVKEHSEQAIKEQQKHGGSKNRNKGKREKRPGKNFGKNKNKGRRK